MTRIQWYNLFRGAAYLVVLALLMAGTNRPAAAQNGTDDVEVSDTDGYGDPFYVEGDLEVNVDPTTGEIDIYAETDLSYFQYYSYTDACVEVDVDTQAGTLTPSSGEGALCYEGPWAALLQEYDDVPDSDSYVAYGYSDAGYDNWCDYTEEYVCDYGDEADTYVDITEMPYIDSINPTGDGLGNSGTINVNGNNLVNFNDCNATAEIEDSNVNLTLTGADCTYGQNASFSYSIPADDDPEQSAFIVSNGYGDSNEVNFSIIGATITVNLCPSGGCGLSDGDYLSYNPAPSCGDLPLGPTGCAAGWFWNVEVAATVGDDAANWTVTQDLDSATDTTTSAGSNTPNTVHVGWQTDNPTAAVQQTPGTLSVFYLDSPGQPLIFGQNYTSVQFQPVFTSRVCSNVSANTYCVCVNWNFNLGGDLNQQGTAAQVTSSSSAIAQSTYTCQPQR